MKFIAHFTSVASTAIEIEADDADEAQEKADEISEFPTLCGQCQGWGGRQNLDLGGDWEQDGEVEPA